jgi:lipoate---protein ligase
MPTSLPMTWLDLTFDTPAENLACDEALLERAELEGGPGILRFWEPTQYFVVLGYGKRAEEEANLEACRAEDVPILRRCSGGGTVLQGPGCLNYSLILSLETDVALHSITGANCFIMKRQRTALARLLDRPVAIEGHTDLALDGVKFSGNAQRRKRDWLLFHGTLLLDFDLARIGRLLLPPPVQPAYRRQRSHESFLTCLRVEAGAVKSALREAWQSEAPSTEAPTALIERLVTERYGRQEWNLRTTSEG